MQCCVHGTLSSLTLPRPRRKGPCLAHLVFPAANTESRAPEALGKSWLGRGLGTRGSGLPKLRPYDLPPAGGKIESRCSGKGRNWAERLRLRRAQPPTLFSRVPEGGGPLFVPSAAMVRRVLRELSGPISFHPPRARAPRGSGVPAGGGPAEAKALRPAGWPRRARGRGPTPALEEGGRSVPLAGRPRSLVRPRPTTHPVTLRGTALSGWSCAGGPGGQMMAPGRVGAGYAGPRSGFLFFVFFWRGLT